MNAREQRLFDRLCSTLPAGRRVIERGDPHEAGAARESGLDAAKALEDVDAVVVVGQPGASLADEAARHQEHAYVTRVRLVDSEVFAWVGGEPPGLGSPGLGPSDLGPSDLGNDAGRGTDAPREVLLLERRSPTARSQRLPADLTNDVFSIGAYQRLLADAQARGYRFIGFEEALALSPDDAGRYILLRHDVDFSPSLSVRVAEVEAAWSVTSTWFFLLSGAFYNLLEPDHRRVVRRVRALGHTLGFHYDQEDDIAEGLDILSVVAGERLRHIAQHNPTLLPQRALERADVVDAYDPRITGQQSFVYVSDSGMRWRHKSFADLVAEGCPRIYALCHPESWLTEGRDLVTVVRSVEAREHTRARRRFDAFVEATIGYLRGRKEREGR